LSGTSLRSASARGEGAPASAGTARRWIWIALGVVLAVALGLRLWGIKEGLPYVYDIDEAAHFVPRAITISGLQLNPHYFANPPALTYLLHAIFAVWFGGHAGVAREAAQHPAEVYIVARATVAVLGTVAVWLVYVLGSRLFDRRVGLLAAALEAVAFLPVFYSHLALNDVPALVPLTAALIGAAGIMQRGRARDYLLAGAGLGFGAATKYTAGIVVLPLLAATAIQYGAARAGRSRQVSSASARTGGAATGTRAAFARAAGASRPLPAVEGLLLAVLVALLCFSLANPYSVLDFHGFTRELAHESAVAEEAGGKLGSPHEPGILYYLWSFTWGLGVIPSLAALGGAIAVWFKDARLGWLLTPMIVAYLAFMGTESRYFGRWLMPLLPVACVLAAFFALVLASALTRALCRALARRSPAPGLDREVARAGADGDQQRLPAVPRGPSDGRRRARTARGGRPLARRTALIVAGASSALVVAALLAQSLVYSVHSDLVLSRPDTRAVTRAWMLAHVPEGARIVLEPVGPQAWLHQGPALGPLAASYRGTTRDRWSDYPLLLWLIEPRRGTSSGWRRVRHYVRVEDYEYTLTPALLAYYEQRGYCWVVTGSQQSGRAFADPHEAPGAIAYYRALSRQAEVAYHISPYARTGESVPFSFDWSFDYYPLSYRLPGPEMTVYRLRGGSCAAST
jgi:Dolichyl-phosphate-mannose-protein mannosyltransferase